MAIHHRIIPKTSAVARGIAGMFGRAAVMAAAEARAFLQPRLHALNPVCRTQGELFGKVPKSVCSAVFSMDEMRAAVSKT